MLKETEKHRLFRHIFISSVISIREEAGALPALLATPMSERWAPGTAPYGKTDRDYCITFIKG